MVDNQDEKPTKRTRRVSSNAASKKEKPEAEDSNSQPEAQESKATDSRPVETESRQDSREDRETRSTDREQSSYRDDDRRNRNRRGRFRDRDRRRNQEESEPEILEDDVLIPVAGILDVLDNYAFLRTSGYLPGPNDVYVSLGQVKKYGLRKGDAIIGSIRQPREGEYQRQKFNALVRVETVNGQTLEEAQ
jgi:transcription termination factor Rho